MSNTEIVNETADIDDIELHEVYVYIADDNMSASVRLGKCDEGYTYDEVMNKLSLNGIKTGIDIMSFSLIQMQLIITDLQ